MSNADAGIDDERVSPRLTSFTKQNFRRCLFSPFCHLPLIAAAKVSKEGSMSAIRVWPSRCSASVERPRRAAQRFYRAISSEMPIRFTGIEHKFWRCVERASSLA
jgi:hypothetical protein